MPPDWTGWTTAAPAPSPNKTQVFLSVQSVTEESTSTPITRAFLYVPDCMKFFAVTRPYKNPVQAAFISKQAAFFAPIFDWTKHAVEGSGISGVTVATMRSSTSSGFNFASSSAFMAASAARALEGVPGFAILRFFMPVRVVIHSSDVSTIFSSSSFVRTCFGTYMPKPSASNRSWEQRLANPAII